MQQPPCDGSYITVVASPIGSQATAGSVASVLEQYPGSNYLRTDQTCPSLTPAVDGEPVYVIFFGPFAFDSDACAARAEGPAGSYARRLSSDLGPDHSVACT
jgi:serine/threonine-protein kinase